MVLEIDSEILVSDADLETPWFWFKMSKTLSLAVSLLFKKPLETDACHNFTDVDSSKDPCP